MITFLPYTDFEKCAACLDDKRLGAQRYEAWSIVKWLRRPQDHPSLVRAGYCRMWEGHVPTLVRYTNAMLVEWARRGKNNGVLRPYDPARGLDRTHEDGDGDGDASSTPPWMGDETLHSYHRHALVSKDPVHYGRFGWSEDGAEYNGSYPWPVRDDDGDGDGDWILRWPKYVKLPSVRMVLAAANNRRSNRRNEKQRTNDAETMRNSREIGADRGKGTKRRRASEQRRDEASSSEKRTKRRRTRTSTASVRMRLRSGRCLLG